MKQVEDLTCQLLDGDLDADGAKVLDRLLDDDAEARRIHIHMAEVEAVLRGRRATRDLTDPIMVTLRNSAVEGQREDRIVNHVMNEVSRRPVPATRGYFWAWLIPLAMAGVAVLLVARGVLNRRVVVPDAPVASQTTGANAGVATLTEFTGAVTIARAGQRTRAQLGQPLYNGDRIETLASARAVLTVADVARLDLGPETTFLVTNTFALMRGSLGAEIEPRRAERPVVFLTPHARATVLGTGLSLLVTTEKTRMDVSHGRVRFERLFENNVVEVTAGQNAEAIEGALVDAAPPVTGADAGRAVTTLVDLNVSGDVLPPMFIQGQLVTTGCRPGRRNCVIGTLAPGELAMTNLVKLESKSPPLFQYFETAVFTFDYWLGTDAQTLAFQLWNPTRRQNYSIVLKNVVQGQWARAEVRLSDFSGNVKPMVPMEPGDLIPKIFIAGGHTAGDPFYVDNIRIIDYPADAGPKRSGTRPLSP